MELSGFNPNMLFMDQRTCCASYATPIVAYDWRLFFVLAGNACVIIENETLKLRAGDCLVFRSGLVYQFFFDRTSPAKMYVINFDLDCSCFGAEARRTVQPEAFCPEKLNRETLPAPMDRLLLVHQPELEEALSVLLAEHQSGRYGYAEMCSAYLKNILIRVYRAASGGAREDDLVQSIVQYLEEHYREKISGKELSQRFNYHAYYLGKRFLACTGQSIHQYVLSLRIRKCARLLLDSSWSISEIAEKCGFSSPSYLSEYFRKVYRMTPAEYRKRGQLL